MKRIIFLSTCILLAGLTACSKDDDDEQPKIDIPPAFANLPTQNWIFYANYDTTYTYYDTVKLVNNIPVPPVTGRTVPLIANACGQNTLYRFRDNGEFALQDCNMNSGVLGSWSVKTDPAANADFVYLTASKGNMMTPFFTDPIPAGQSRYLYGLTIIGNSELQYYFPTATFNGVKLNDSTGVGGAEFILLNRRFRSQ